MSFNQLFIQQTEPGSYQFTEADFDLSRWRSEKESVALTGGRGASQKIVIQHESYVLRHYLRGGLIARLSHDQYVWTGLTHSRPYLETKAILQALQHDLPVPEVMAYCVHKTGLFYRASIVSRFIKNEGTLATFLYDNKMTDQQWTALGSLIQRLHRAHIFHADLNANNILIDEQGKFYIIDFDKAEILESIGMSSLGMSSSGNAGEKNIQRLLRSLTKIQMLRKQQNLPFNFNSRQWQLLLQGYK